MKRHTILPFLRNGNWSARIPRLNAPAITRALGVTDKAMATKLCAFLGFLKGKGDYPTLTLLITGEASILAAFQAWQVNGLDAYIKGIHQAKTDCDLEPLVAKWESEMVRVNHPQPDTRTVYLRQLRTLMPEGKPFPASRFIKPDGKPDKDTIKNWLSTVGPMTGNRYHAALSAFCEYVVAETDALPFNPARTVKYTKPADNDEPVFLEMPDVVRVLDALEGESRAYHALAAATGMERQSLGRLLRRHVDLDNRTVFASASKRSWRRRTATVYSRWTSAWDIFAAYLKAHPKLPDAPVFTVKPDYAYRQLKDVCKVLGLDEKVTVHTWRHTWGVRAVRDGLAIQTVAHQLGHKDAVMTLRIYGRFIPNRTDFEPNVTQRRTSESEGSAANG